MSRCPEAVIVSELRGIPLVIRCDLDGGHPGNHVADTQRGECEWPRIAGVPARFDERYDPSPEPRQRRIS